MPSLPHAATAAPRAARTPLNIGYLVDNTAQRPRHTPGRRCDACEGHCLAPIGREAELEATVADRLRAATAELHAAQVASIQVGYGDQFREAIDHAIDQVEVTRRMLA